MKETFKEWRTATFNREKKLRWITRPLKLNRLTGFRGNAVAERRTAGNGLLTMIVWITVFRKDTRGTCLLGLWSISNTGIKISRLLIAIAAGFSRAEDLEAYTRGEREREQIFSLTNETFIFSGLEAWEKPSLQFLKPSGVIGVMGCGAGREMIALEGLGYTVDGVDSLPRLIDAAKIYLKQAKAKGLVYCDDIHHFEFPRERYDAFLFTWKTFGMIPGARRRVALLKNLSGKLTDSGRIIIAAKPVTTRGRRFIKLARGIAQLTGNPDPPAAGDTFSLQLGFEHTFARQEIENEAQQAGFLLDSYFDNGCQILAVLAKK